MVRYRRESLQRHEASGGALLVDFDLEMGYVGRRAINGFLHRGPSDSGDDPQPDPGSQTQMDSAASTRSSNSTTGLGTQARAQFVQCAAPHTSFEIEWMQAVGSQQAADDFIAAQRIPKYPAGARPCRRSGW